ncbi:glycoside hydrolase family 15 protein [Arthrobacter monumenti]
MASPIEDYALLTDQHTGPLVSRTGSIEWLCFPRFDSESVFASLLGDDDDGHWRLSAEGGKVTEWSYIESTFVLQSRWETPDGAALVTDFMPVGDRRASVVRRVEGLEGEVTMATEFRIRFGYGDVLPWVQRIRNQDENLANHDGEAIVAMAGPDALVIHGNYLPKPSGHSHKGKFTVKPGEVVDLELIWFPSHRQPPTMTDVDKTLKETTRFWQDWASHCTQKGPYAGAVERSLLVLKALTHEDTGGIVAAPTTSLPEHFGGERNWDYRFCWLRDAALTLEAMLVHGYEDEAQKWRNWLLRAVAGDPEDLQIMYAIDGGRNLPEKELAHLSGYEESTPVRVGNGAVSQYQADVVGEVMVSLEKLRNAGVKEDNFSWPLQRAMLGYLEKHFDDKDHGIWEMRGPQKYFTHSRVMMWAALDRGVRAVREHGLRGPAERWQKLVDALRDEIMERGFNKELNSFTQAYGEPQTDASLLQIPQVGFLPFDDPHMLGTVAYMEQELLDDAGLLLRYRTHDSEDGLAPGEHPFMACSFWLVEQYACSGRGDEARQLMDQLIGYSNELGLLSEEYATSESRMAGNFPQAFSHLTLVRAADALEGHPQDPVEPVEA